MIPAESCGMLTPASLRHVFGTVGRIHGGGFEKVKINHSDISFGKCQNSINFEGHSWGGEVLGMKIAIEH